MRGSSVSIGFLAVNEQALSLSEGEVVALKLRRIGIKILKIKILKMSYEGCCEVTKLSSWGWAGGEYQSKVHGIHLADPL